AHDVHVDEKLKRYIVELVATSRQAGAVIVRSNSGAALLAAELIDYGASPRATLALTFLSRGRALLAGRDFALPDDVRAVAAHALSHRIGFNYRLATDGIAAQDVIDALIAAVPAP
ncbi:MAG: hypothetical protein WAK19_15710, partial [Candidatus Cybelea sp.]